MTSELSLCVPCLRGLRAGNPGLCRGSIHEVLLYDTMASFRPFATREVAALRNPKSPHYPGRIVIPGHGPVGGLAELAEFRDMLATIREKVASLKKKGCSLAETVAATPTGAFDAKWGNFLITAAAFTGLVYMGV